MKIADNYELEIFNARQHIFVRIMRKQWYCKLENSPVGTGPWLLKKSRVVPSQDRRHIITKIYFTP